MENKNILISGGGIAGLSLAYWLKQFGFTPTVIEISPTLRAGGYMIDFWGVGFDIAEKMNIINELKQKHYNIPEMVFVNEKGKRVGGFNVEKLRKLINYRHYNMLRGELATVLYNCIKDNTEIIFDTTISEIEEIENHVRVKFSDGSSRNFDLLVGADGLHSKVRSLSFGPESDFEKFLGYYTSSFTIDNYLNKFPIFESLTVKSKWAGIYSIADNKLATFFVYKDSEKYNFRHNTQEQQEVLKEKFKDVGWECPTMLEKMPEANDFYFDAVSQIKMKDWSKGRIMLIGDAAHCVSLIAGKGAVLAMAEGYVLAGELKRAGGNYSIAYKKFDQVMRNEVERTQKMAFDFAPSFIPDSNFGLWKRNTFTNLMFLPVVSNWFIKQFLSERLKPEIY